MSVGEVSLLLLICFVIAIAIGFIKGLNTGILGMSFAIVIGIATGVKFPQIRSQFPVNVFITLFAVSAFFGYFVDNGTVGWLAKIIIYRFRGVPKILPFLFFATGMLMGALGGPSMVAFVCALSFPVGHASGMKPAQVASVSLLGTQVGAFTPFSQYGSVARGLIDAIDKGRYVDQGSEIIWKIFGTQFICYMVIMLVYYIYFKNYKLQKIEGIEKPGPLDAIQRKSLWIIGCAFALIVLVPLIARQIGNPGFSRLAAYCDVVPVCLFGCTVNSLLKLGNETEVIKKRVPWNTMTMIFGMGMMVGLANLLGVLDYLTGIVGKVPPAYLSPVFVFSAAFISLFSSSLSVVMPSLLPIAGMLAVSTGVNPIMLFASICIASVTTAQSPLSAGGGQIVGACTEEICDSRTIFNSLFATALACLVMLVILSFLGAFNIFHIAN